MVPPCFKMDGNLDNRKIKKVLGWKAKFNNIEKIIKSAIKWEKKI